MTTKKGRGWAKRQDGDGAAHDYTTIVQRQEGQTVPVPVALDPDGDRINRDALLVDHGRVRPDPEQPRHTMDREGLRELAGSIMEHGMLQPLVVREEAPDQHGDNRYMIVAGGRRWAAIDLALRGELGPLDEVTLRRLRRVPILLDHSEGAVRRIRQLIENIQRQALPPLEEARAIRELMQLERLSAREIARRLHKSHPYVNERLAVLDDEAISQAVERNLLSFTAATELRKLGDIAVRHQLLTEVQQGRQLRVADVRAIRPRTASTRAVTAPTPTPTSIPTEATGSGTAEQDEWKVIFDPDTLPLAGTVEGPRPNVEASKQGDAQTTPADAGDLPLTDSSVAQAELVPPDYHPAATDAWVRHLTRNWLRWLNSQDGAIAAELRVAVLERGADMATVPDWWLRFFHLTRQMLADEAQNTQDAVGSPQGNGQPA